MLKHFPISAICGSLMLIGLTSSAALAQHKHHKPLKQLDLRVKMSNQDSCGIDTIRLYGWTGVQVEEISKAAAAPTKSGGIEFHFQLKNVPLGNYYLGRIVNNAMTDMRPVYLGLEERVVLKGNCNALPSVAFEDSKVNVLFEQMIDSIKAQGSEFYNLLVSYQQNQGKAEVQAENKKALADLDFRRKEMLNKLKKEQPELAAIAALYTYQSFQNNQKNPTQNEGQYIGETYFQFADLSDTNYVRSAFFYESVKSFATNLGQVGINEDQMATYLDAILEKVGKNNPHYRPALLAISFGVMSKSKKLFLKYAETYQSRYKGQNAMLDNFIDQQIAQLKSSTEIGDEAPVFTDTRPDGSKLSLKDLRGKVVLLDFWASWCGPCRRENPNVVAVYNKYKDKGFDVLGVSLDTDRQKWLDAIAKDGLTWNHVSDLAGWNCAAAKLYKVTGIPNTLLIDKNGVIIAKNLRGPALEQKLKELFGE